MLIKKQYESLNIELEWIRSYPTLTGLLSCHPRHLLLLKDALQLKYLITQDSPLFLFLRTILIFH